MRPSGIVTIMTDFGTSDGYVAAMKGVLLTMYPEVVIVDISHHIPSHDIVAGAFVLASAAAHFPVGTVHVAVVDPGVGSDRAALVIRTNREWFVAPDNGLLSRALDLGSRAMEIVSIDEVPGYSASRSATFHGRDIFAPAAAYLARGDDMGDLGDRLAELVSLPLPEIKVEQGMVRGEVVHIDAFGNAITNIVSSDLSGCGQKMRFEVGGVEIHGLVTCYADVPRGTVCALLGSGDSLEISLVEGSAAGQLGLRRGDEVRCHFAPRSE